MTKKHTAEVLINGKIYTISGYESTAYLQKVAAYLNEMEERVSAMDGYRRLSQEEKQLLKNMNLADVYFKMLESKEQLERDLEGREKELYALKHDLIDARLEREKLEKQIAELETQLEEEKKRTEKAAQPPGSRRIQKPQERL